MTDPHTGGCLCGALRYEFEGEPTYAGFCYCTDCRKASGAAFVPFMGVPAEAVRFTGEVRQHHARSIRGTAAVRNHCAACGSLVFGGIVGEDSGHTVYAGSLDDPSVFQPSIAIFTRDKPAWVEVPADLVAFETMPGEG